MDVHTKRGLVEELRLAGAEDFMLAAQTLDAAQGIVNRAGLQPLIPDGPKLRTDVMYNLERSPDWTDDAARARRYETVKALISQTTREQRWNLTLKAAEALVAYGAMRVGIRQLVSTGKKSLDEVLEIFSYSGK